MRALVGLCICKEVRKNEPKLPATVPATGSTRVPAASGGRGTTRTETLADAGPSTSHVPAELRACTRNQSVAGEVAVRVSVRCVAATTIVAAPAKLDDVDSSTTYWVAAATAAQLKSKGAPDVASAGALITGGAGTEQATPAVVNEKVVPNAVPASFIACTVQ